MTNTIHNVPRELLEELRDAANDGMNATTRQHQIDYFVGLIAQADALLSAPSPAGVDGLEVVGHIESDDDVFGSYAVFKNDCDLHDGTELIRLSDAQAIIDGLRGEVAAQEETANQWRELALQFDRHRMTAMAHIRAAASGDKSAIEALGVFAALPPIPGHEITAERDQQAQRIGELEGLLLACHSAMYPFDNKMLESEIDAALSTANGEVTK